LYGSVVLGEHQENSDVDICIVAPNQDKYAIYHTCMKGLEGDIEKLDIRFFEELPLLIRADIIEKGLILYTKNLGELTEYFFFSTRRELEDYRFRMEYCQ
jgi:predicted nucleotidyltransferase